MNTSSSSTSIKPFPNAAAIGLDIFACEIGTDDGLRPRLGESREITERYEVNKASFKLGDTLVLYTDGLLETKNCAGEPYGKKRVRAVLEAALASSNDDPRTAANKLMTDLRAHVFGAPLMDDVIVSVSRILS